MSVLLRMTPTQTRSSNVPAEPCLRGWQHLCSDPVPLHDFGETLAENHFVYTFNVLPIVEDPGSSEGLRQLRKFLLKEEPTPRKQVSGEFGNPDGFRNIGNMLCTDRKTCRGKKSGTEEKPAWCVGGVRDEWSLLPCVGFGGAKNSISFLQFYNLP